MRIHGLTQSNESLFKKEKWVSSFLKGSYLNL